MADPTHSYYDWQVSTLMLAYDVIDPIHREDLESQQTRHESVEHEVREIALRVIPPDYQQDQSKELSPEVVMQMTRATLQRASQIVGLL